MQALLPTIIKEEYDLEHPCITITELRWLLQACGRHTPYYTYFLLRTTTGIRPQEAIKLSLYDLSPDLTTITYRVDKPSTRLTKNHEYQQTRKHRRITLDHFTHQELATYLTNTCRNVNGTLISPHPGQRLFPWKNMNVVGAYWYKLRKKMQATHHDSHRTIRTYHRPTKTHNVYVLRPHILRHFAASVMYYKLGNLASVRDWIKHQDTTITNGYLHSAEALGTTPEYLRTATWADITGYDDNQTTLNGLAPAQTSLQPYL